MSLNLCNAACLTYLTLSTLISGDFTEGKYLKWEDNIREEIGASTGPWEQDKKAYSVLTPQRLYQTAKDIHQNLIADAQEYFTAYASFGTKNILHNYIPCLHFTEQKREKQNTLHLEDAIAVGVKEIGIVGGFWVRPRRAWIPCLMM